MSDTTDFWCSLKLYFLGHLVLSHPGETWVYCLFFVVSSMTIEVRKNLWSTFETPLTLLPLFSSSFHPFLASPGERWCVRGVTYPQEEVFQTRVEVFDQRHWVLVFCWSRMCPSMAVSTAESCPGRLRHRGAHCDLSALIASPHLVLKLVPFHLLWVLPMLHSHSFCTHLIKELSCFMDISKPPET